MFPRRDLRSYCVTCTNHNSQTGDLVLRTRVKPCFWVRQGYCMSEVSQ